MFGRMFEGRHRGNCGRSKCHRGHERGEGHADCSERHGMRRGGRHCRGEKVGRRLFEHGDLRRVLLALVAKKPSHGYELIKSIEEASSGLYVPSPGVIYPTLTLLEEQDFLEPITADNGRKSYQITEAGKEELAQHQEAVDAIFARLACTVRSRSGNLAEGISDTMHRLKQILRGNMMRADLSGEQVARVNATLAQAVASIEAEFAAINAEQADKNNVISESQE